MSASPLVLAALVEAEKTNATLSAILTVHVHDRQHVEQEINQMVKESAEQVHETPEECHVYPHIAAVRVRAHPPLIRALLARPEVERANSGLTQAPFAFAARASGNHN
jgi:ABC-type antimicrobial peptide transport system ATPase subunit